MSRQFSILLLSFFGSLIASVDSLCQTESSLLHETYAQRTNGQFNRIRFSPGTAPRLAASWLRIINPNPFISESRIFVFDVASMTPLDTILNGSSQLAFTSDGSYLITVGTAEGSKPAVFLRAYGKSSLGDPIADSVRAPLLIGATPLVYHLRAAPNDRYLYIAGPLGVKVCDLTSEPPVWIDTLQHWTYDGTTPIPQIAFDVAVNSTGSRIASVDGINPIKIWNGMTNEPLWDGPDSSSLFGVHWSTDDLRLLTAAGRYNEPAGRIEERSSEDGRILRSIVIPGARVIGRAYYAMNEQYIIAQCTDTTVRIWNTESLELVDEFRPHNQEFTMDVSSDGRYVATASYDSTMRVFEFVSSSVSEPVTGESSLYLLAPRPNPAHETVEIPFRLVRSTEVELTLIDVQGRPVRSYSARHFEPGHHVERIATGDLSSGVYYVVLRAGGERHTRPVHVVQ